MKNAFQLPFVACLAVVSTVGGLAAQEDLPPEVLAYADMILRDGKILTADDAFTVVEALAVRDGKILAVGDSARIARMAGPLTRVIDLEGKTVTPGFIDTHFHLFNYAFNPSVNGGIDAFPAIHTAELEGQETKQSLLRALRRRGQTTPRRDGWIVFTDARDEGHTVLEKKLFPVLTQADLDETFPDGPAAVGASHGNNYSFYIVNSAGMKIALEKMPANIEGIRKDPKTGQFTGQFTGPAASLFGRAVLPWPDMKLVLQLLEDAIAMYSAQGLTLVQTKTPGFVMAALRELWRRDEMQIRWRASVSVGPETEVGFKYLGNLTDLGDSILRISSGPGGVPRPFWDATYQEPKPLPGWRGLTRPHRSMEARRAELKGATDTFLAAKYGWSTSNVHNNGDMSTDAYMSEIEKGLQARALEAYGQRFVTDHGLMLTPETPAGKQFERMKALGIIPSLNVGHLMEPMPSGSDMSDSERTTQVEYLSQQWGKERVFKMLPAKSLIRAGLKPTLESDRWYYPASYPLWSLEKMVTRKDDKFGIVWGQGERVSRQEALWMKTNWAARYSGDERELGTLEPGKLADLVILDGDYLAVAEDEISDIGVLMTIMGGNPVFDAEKGQLPRPGEDLPGVAGVIPR